MTVLALPDTQVEARSLRQLVRDVYDGADTPDLDVITDLVFDAIADRDGALREALRVLVRDVCGNERRRTRFADPGAGGGTVAAGGSWRVDAVRAYHHVLRTTVHVGQGSRKFLGDCTADDLLHAETERRKIAADNQAWARRYAALRHLLVDHDVATPRELPQGVLLAAIDAG